MSLKWIRKNSHKDEEGKKPTRITSITTIPTKTKYHHHKQLTFGTIGVQSQVDATGAVLGMVAHDGDGGGNSHCLITSLFVDLYVIRVDLK